MNLISRLQAISIFLEEQKRFILSIHKDIRIILGNDISKIERKLMINVSEALYVNLFILINKFYTFPRTFRSPGIIFL